MTGWLPESWRHTAARVRDDIHRAIERWWGRHELQGEPRALEIVPASPPSRRSWSSSVRVAALDVEETDDEIVVTADLPGVDRDDYTVEVSGARLMIRGEKQYAAERREQGYYYAERSYGAFARAVPLPCAVDAEKAAARYKDGVLRVTLPKTSRAKASRVHVKIK